MISTEFLKSLKSELCYQLRWALPIWSISLLTNWWPDNRISFRLRGFLLSKFIRKCGKGLQVGRNVTLVGTHRLEVGDNVYVAYGAWLNCLAGLKIEDEVILGPYVVISTLQHAFRNGSARFGGSNGARVSIGRGSWLAAHVSVKCGVSIGSSNLIAANACVTKSTSTNLVMGGVPARVLAHNKDGESAFLSRVEMKIYE